MVRPVRLHIENRGIIVTAEPGQTVLEAMEAAGLRAPSGCRYGACRTCAGRLVEGHLSMPPGTAITDEQLEERYFLACVAVPRTDCRVELGEGRGMLPVLPWTD